MSWVSLSIVGKMLKINPNYTTGLKISGKRQDFLALKVGSLSESRWTITINKPNNNNNNKHFPTGVRQQKKDQEFYIVASMPMSASK